MYLVVYFFYLFFINFPKNLISAQSATIHKTFLPNIFSSKNSYYAFMILFILLIPSTQKIHMCGVFPSPLLKWSHLMKLQLQLKRFVIKGKTSQGCCWRMTVVVCFIQHICKGMERNFVNLFVTWIIKKNKVTVVSSQNII